MKSAGSSESYGGISRGGASERGSNHLGNHSGNTAIPDLVIIRKVGSISR